MTKAMKIGNLAIGGGSAVSVQSMTTVRTSDTAAAICQVSSLAAAGCDIVRVAVRDEADARAIRAIKDSVKVPIVADIHFDYKLALLSAENEGAGMTFHRGLGKIGNLGIGNTDGLFQGVGKIAQAAAQHQTDLGRERNAAAKQFRADGFGGIAAGIEAVQFFILFTPDNGKGIGTQTVGGGFGNR